MARHGHRLTYKSRKVKSTGNKPGHNQHHRPGRASASLSILLQDSLSLATIHHCLTQILLVSSATPTSHLSLGRPVLLLPSGSHPIIHLGSSCSPIILTFPAHLNLEF